jgi:nanoRNase/pAp phosphatase (c-di-AMP/oligoRNAs hydrolase)
MINEFSRMIADSKSITLVTHRSPDLDSFTSALLFRDYLNGLGKPNCLTYHGKVDRETRQVLERLGIELPSSQECGCGDLTIMFDVANRSQLGIEVCGGGRLVVFDHHEVRGFRGDLEFIDPTSPSTVELVVNVLRGLGYRPSDLMAKLALIAIVNETNRFSRATQRTFETVAWLLGISPINYSDALAILTRELDESAKIALIKGSMRVVPYRVRSMVMCVTNVNAYEGLVASRLLELGCDAVFVVSDHGDELRVVARSRNFDVAAVLGELASQLSGEGGGHSGAGMLVTRVKQPYIKILNLLIKVIEYKLGERPREIK